MLIKGSMFTVSGLFMTAKASKWETKASTICLPSEPWLITGLYNGSIIIYYHQRA